MAVSPRWPAEPPRSRASVWRDRIGWVAGLSLLLHISIVALVFLSPAPPKPQISDESPPGEVALVFQGGSTTGPTSPTPSPEVSVGPPSPDTALTAPPVGTVSTPDAVAPASPPVADASPIPPLQAPPITAPATPPPFSTAEPNPAPAPPDTAALAPAPLPPLAMLPAPQIVPPTASPVPEPTRPPAPPPSQRVEPARPATPPRPAPPRPRVVQPRPDAFPRPLNFAFGNGLVGGQGSVGRAAPHDSMGPVAPGPSSRAAFNSDIKGNLGPDYRNQLRNWLERHKYYPQQAIEEGEDGTASVRVMVRKDGSVRLVELDERSGSQWLDMGAQALFRGQRLPPFPSEAMGDEQEIYVTIHYILIRG